MLKAIILGALYNLSDEALEHEMGGNRLTFIRFLGLGLEDRILDATTVWLYREQLARAGIVERLFGMFDAFLQERGYQAMGGQIVDASIVPVQHRVDPRDKPYVLRLSIHVSMIWTLTSSSRRDRAEGRRRSQP